MKMENEIIFSHLLMKYNAGLNLYQQFSQITPEQICTIFGTF